MSKYCSICLEYITDNTELLTTSCNHHFHYSCYKSYCLIYLQDYHDFQKRESIDEFYKDYSKLIEQVTSTGKPIVSKTRFTNYTLLASKKSCPNCRSNINLINDIVEQHHVENLKQEITLYESVYDQLIDICSYSHLYLNKNYVEKLIKVLINSTTVNKNVFILYILTKLPCSIELTLIIDLIKSLYKTSEQSIDDTYTHLSILFLPCYFNKNLQLSDEIEKLHSVLFQDYYLTKSRIQILMKDMLLHDYTNNNYNSSTEIHRLLRFFLYLIFNTHNPILSTDNKVLFNKIISDKGLCKLIFYLAEYAYPELLQFFDFELHIMNNHLSVYDMFNISRHNFKITKFNTILKKKLSEPQILYNLDIMNKIIGDNIDESLEIIYYKQFGPPALTIRDDNVILYYIERLLLKRKNISTLLILCNKKKTILDGYNTSKFLFNLFSLIAYSSDISNKDKEDYYNNLCKYISSLNLEKSKYITFIKYMIYEYHIPFYVTDYLLCEYLRKFDNDIISLDLHNNISLNNNLRLNDIFMRILQIYETNKSVVIDYLKYLINNSSFYLLYIFSYEFNMVHQLVMVYNILDLIDGNLHYIDNNDPDYIDSSKIILYFRQILNINLKSLKFYTTPLHLIANNLKNHYKNSDLVYYDFISKFEKYCNIVDYSGNTVYHELILYNNHTLYDKEFVNYLLSIFPSCDRNKKNLYDITIKELLEF